LTYFRELVGPTTARIVIESREASLGLRRSSFVKREASAFSDEIRDASDERPWDTYTLCERTGPTTLPSPSFFLFEQPPKRRLDLVQSLAQVKLKGIGLGLNQPALLLQLVFEHLQLGEQLLLP